MKYATVIIGLMCASTLNVQWTNGQAAQYVIGQPDFTTYTTYDGGATNSRIYNPMKVAIDAAHGKMNVVDKMNYRILRFAYPIAGNNPAAEAVFGQPNFTTKTPPPDYGGTPTAKTFRPCAVAVYNGVLWVADDGNVLRILKFSNAYSAANNPDADGVLGQVNFTARAQETTDATFFALGF